MDESTEEAILEQVSGLQVRMTHNNNNRDNQISC